MTIPYGSTTGQVAGEYSHMPNISETPRQEFVPDEMGNTEFITALGWAPKLDYGLSLPDAQRIQTQRTFTVRPDSDEAPEDFYGPLDNDARTRESVTSGQQASWIEHKGTYYPGDDPRWHPPMEDRVTASYSPASYSFQRPWDQLSKGNGAREFNGTHFSFADHRREYDVLTMAPAMNYRNTYRASPSPWDADMYDMPPQQQHDSNLVQSVDAPAASRSYRL